MKISSRQPAERHDWAFKFDCQVLNFDLWNSFQLNSTSRLKFYFRILKRDLAHSRHQMPIKWLALECLQHHIFTHKSDIWSFGWCISVVHTSPLHLWLLSGTFPLQPIYCRSSFQFRFYFAFRGDRLGAVDVRTETVRERTGARHSLLAGEGREAVTAGDLHDRRTMLS